MSQPRKIMLIQCKKEGRYTYYSNGISCLNIPFEKFINIELQIITFQTGFQLICDRFPALIRFQKAWKRRFQWLRSTRRWLHRQECGIAIRPPHFLEEVTHHE